MRRRALLGGAVGAMATVAWGLGPGCATTPAASTSAEGEPLAGLTDMAGQPLAPPPSLAGSAAILDFWASWCVPCRQAFRYMDQLYRTYEGDGLKLLAVSVDDDLVSARRFWAAARPRFAAAWDAGGGVRERFSVLTLPTTVLFDAGGELVHRLEGFDPGEHRILEEQVRRLLRR